MDSVWNFLSKIPVGTIVAWACVIITISTMVCTATVKVCKAFARYTKLKRENEEQKKLIQKLDDLLIEVNDSLKKIADSLDEQTQVNLKQIRHTIVHTCDDALEAGMISASKLRSLEEMYEEYVEVFHGNGYVKTLMKKTRELPVMGHLDE